MIIWKLEVKKKKVISWKQLEKEKRLEAGEEEIKKKDQNQKVKQGKNKNIILKGQEKSRQARRGEGGQGKNVDPRIYA